MKIAVLILHYNSYQSTIDCIKSLEVFQNQEFDIYVLNNGSTNDSGKRLEAEFSGTKIQYFTIDHNLGFSNGFNYLFKSVIKIQKYNLYVFANNDLIFCDPRFMDYISKVYLNYNYDILGPDIVKPNGIHQNPIKVTPSKSLFHVGLSIIKLWFFSIFSFIKRKNKVETSSIGWDKQAENVVLHAACLIFSQNWFEKTNYEYCFFPKNSMYMEENILWLISQKNGAKMIYTPFIRVIHNHSVATNDLLSKKRIKKEKFVYKQHLLSSIEYFRILKKNKEKII